MIDENKTAIFYWSDNKTFGVELQQEDDECIYRGSFKEDPGSRVLVTGCEWEERSIQIQSVLYGDTLGTSVNGSVKLLQGHGHLLVKDILENDELIQQLQKEQRANRSKREYIRNPDFLKQFPTSNNKKEDLVVPKFLVPMSV